MLTPGVHTITHQGFEVMLGKYDEFKCGLYNIFSSADTIKLYRGVFSRVARRAEGDSGVRKKRVRRLGHKSPPPLQKQPASAKRSGGQVPWYL